MSLLSLMDKLAAIERSTPSRASTGEVSPSWDVVATDVPCRIEAASVRGKLGEVGFVLVGEFVGCFPSGTDLRPRTGDGLGDRVVVEDVRYMVLGVWPAGGKERFLLAALERMR